MNGSIVIVARNNLFLTKLAVKSALNQDVPCDVLVVDNCSSDGTGAWLRTKNVAVINPIDGQQKSLSWCWNMGLKAYWRIKRYEALVLNNDIEIRPDAYRLLVGQMALGRAMVTGVSVNHADDMVGNRVPANLWDSSSPHPDYSCFMIGRHATADRGMWFDESYFPAYCEDCDHHIRMHRAGLDPVAVDVPFLHHGAQTLKLADEWEAAKIRRGADINRAKFREKYGCEPGTPEYEKLFL